MKWDSMSENIWLVFGGSLVDPGYSDYDPRSSFSAARKHRVVQDGVEQCIQQVSLGWKHGASVSAAGSVFVWGSDGQCGRLGLSPPTRNAQAALGRLEQHPVLVPLPSCVKARKVLCGMYHTVVLGVDASEWNDFDNSRTSIWAWGANFSGQLGSRPASPGDFSGFPCEALLPKKLTTTDVAAGDNHSLLVTSSGAVWSWGDNRSGQCGFPRTDALIELPREVLFHSVEKPVFTNVCACNSTSIAYNSKANVCMIWGGGRAGSEDIFFRPCKVLTAKRSDQKAKKNGNWTPANPQTVQNLPFLKSAALGGTNGAWLCLLDNKGRLHVGSTLRRPVTVQPVPFLRDCIQIEITNTDIFALHDSGIVFVLGPLPEADTQLLQLPPKPVSRPSAGSKTIQMWPLKNLAAISEISASRNQLIVAASQWTPDVLNFFSEFGATRNVQFPFLPRDLDLLKQRQQAEISSDDLASQSDEDDDLKEALRASRREYKKLQLDAACSTRSTLPPPSLKFLCEVQMARQLQLSFLTDSLRFASSPLRAEGLHLYCLLFLVANLSRCLLSLQFSHDNLSQVMSLVSERCLTASYGALVVFLTSVFADELRPLGSFVYSPLGISLHTIGRDKFCRDIASVPTTEALMKRIAGVATEIATADSLAERLYGNCLDTIEKMLGHPIELTTQQAQKTPESIDTYPAHFEPENASSTNHSERSTQDQNAPQVGSHVVKKEERKESPRADLPTLLNAAPSHISLPFETGILTEREPLSTPRCPVEESAWIPVQPKKRQFKIEKKNLASPNLMSPNRQSPQQSPVVMTNIAAFPDIMESRSVEPKVEKRRPCQETIRHPQGKVIPAAATVTQRVGWRNSPTWQRNVAPEVVSIEVTAEEEELAMALEAIEIMEREEAITEAALMASLDSTQLSAAPRVSSTMGRGRAKGNNRRGRRPRVYSGR
eukprot:Gregarina_sp_Poly_1__9637@NODE_60_length_16930_cov_139_480579_g51_i0_p2_GENE_NODE_60_length_16930_cov_139_480579_g51_i0NODE_60_length_16930_cov_139_480579_g51_i0_p2_ORF_typecomplete_len943_score148_40RCC1/PF00415_18/7e02RCC1/PF00415_18/2e06RCC1/PF00415_18/5_7e05RCC1/PF00415_18/0_0014RCC1_2/PF13540_6/0_41RCC1_2/PF13540_6/0_029RCC1_2/PF13540_6/1_1e10_NODE_60_length_16930_cov_139_480579_g51_i011623990